MNARIAVLAAVIIAGSAAGQATPPVALPETAETAPSPAAAPTAPAPTLEELAKKVEVLGKNITVTTGDEQFKLVLGGAVVADFLYSTHRPVASGTPFFLLPGPLFGNETQTFDAHARQTTLFGLFTGPDVHDFKTGGFILVNLYDNSIVQDRYGLLPINAFGELKNDDWRFAAGYQNDVFNPALPTVLPFSLLGASGNVGVFRGQARVERFLHPDPDTQVTLTGALTEPIPTTLNDQLRISEDNGLPNLEGRAAIAFGTVRGAGLEAKRPIEFGVSGTAGQLRTTQGTRRVIADVWGAGIDFRWAGGVQGEAFVGQGLGTYGASGLTSVRADTFQAIRAAGLWVEGFYYWCPDTVHTHVGFGIDDAVDGDVGATVPVRNQTYYATTIWDVTAGFRVGFQVSYLRTAYSLLRDNEALIFHTQFQFKF